MYPVTIDSGRIRLREFTEPDLADSDAVFGDPAVTSSLRIDPLNRERQATMLATASDRARSQPRPEYLLAVVENATDLVVGFARLSLDRPPGAELGYAIRRDRWGNGYATAAATAMLEYGFDSLGLHRVQATCGPDNTASQHVLRKLGFCYEGRMREHVFANRAWRDSLLYSLLEHERDLGTD